jgi:serine/threonine protein kinase
MTGKVIGTYQIVQQLGQGLHGTTYQAIEQGRGQTVALKVIQPALAQQVTFKQDLRALAAVLIPMSHPHMAAFHTILQMGNELYTIREFISGTPLGEALQRSDVLPCEEAIRIAVQVLDALSYAHSSGVLHGGIKPSNLILTADGQIKLTDLGLAAVSGTSVWQDRLNESVLNYVTPEQLLGKTCDARTDVYSLGAVLYEMLTGSPPFRRANDAALRHAHLEELPPSPRNYFPLIPLPLEQALLRTLAKSPSARFSSAAEFRQALMSWANEVKASSNSVAAEINPSARPANIRQSVSPIATALPQAQMSAKSAPKLSPTPTPNDWPQLSPQTSAGRVTSSPSLVSTGLNDEVVVSLEESTAGKRSFWKPIVTVTGIAVLLGVTYAVVRISKGDTPALGPNQSIIQVSPTLIPPSATPASPEVASETAAVPISTEQSRIKESVPSPTVPPKRPVVSALSAKSKPTPTAKASTTLLPTKITKARPAPTPNTSKKNPTPIPTPSNTNKKKKEERWSKRIFQGSIWWKREKNRANTQAEKG